MKTVLYRLAEALQPEYEVEHEIASGGMGSVFAARDVALDRMVAVKIIKPELATALAAERFLQEARVLAQIRHPNVVPVHRAGEAAGFFYYVMDLVDGETLAQRLKRGRLSPDEGVKLGRDLLDAVEAVHGAGVVHRDIKPANIFLVGDRALLADFGISRSSGPQTVSEHPGQGVSGTPGYMPPEQAFGWDITERTDLYAVAIVLYEALTGRRWEAVLPEKPADWSGVPRRLGAILRRALDFDPRMRWPNARAFRHALWRTRTAKYRRRTFLLTVSGLAAGALAAFLLFGGRGELPHDLVVLPFETDPGVDSSVGRRLAELTRVSLNTLDPVSRPVTQHLLDQGLRPEQIVARVNARGYVSALVTEDGGQLTVRSYVVDRDGERREAEPVPWPADHEPPDFGCRLGLAVVRAYSSARGYQCFLSPAPGATDALLDGDEQFARQDWVEAKQTYQAALAFDPSWALAKWRLVNAQRWLREPLEFDLQSLYREAADQLSELDRMLLDAWRTPFGRERLAKYETTVAKYPQDHFAWLFFGDDLLMRGGLLDIGIDSAMTVLEEAIRLDPELAPAYFDLTWAGIRTGRAEQSLQWAQQLALNAVGEEPAPPGIFLWLRTERFEPDQASGLRNTVLQDYEDRLREWLRWGNAFDVAATQEEFARFGLASARPGMALEDRASLHTALGLALFVLGQHQEALTHFDSVADLLGTPEARLQAAQWRVIPVVLGLPALPEGDGSLAREQLEALAQEGDVQARAAWTLALDAMARGNPMEGARYARQVESQTGPAAEDLARALAAVEAAHGGQYGTALSGIDRLVPYEAARASEPFLRSVLYLQRARWQTQVADTNTQAVWRWYENSDLIGWPTRELHTGEVDWAFSAYARYHRGLVAVERGDPALGCSLLRRVLELWTSADTAYQPLVANAQQLVFRECTR